MFNYDKLSVMSPDPIHHDTLDGGSRSDEMSRSGNGVVTVALPSPFAEDTEDRKLAKSRGVLFLGPSAIFLESIRLSAPVSAEEEGAEGDVEAISAEAAQEFDLSYIPLVKGFSTVGGLRVILVEDRLEDEYVTASNIGDERPPSASQNAARQQAGVQILKEWDVIGEIWIKPR